MSAQPNSKPGWDCADGAPDEDHDWDYKTSWYGDPGVINGTWDIYYKVCRVCGKEDDWDGSGHDDTDDWP